MKTNNFDLKEIERPPKLSHQIEEQLNEAIHKQVFGQGEYLPSENELSNIFGVSRNVIREALSMLASKGLINVQKGKGAVVKEPSINSVLDPFSKLVSYKCGNESLNYILAVRQMIEPHVALLAAENRTEQELEKLSASIELMKSSQEDKFEVSHQDINFHILTCRASNNPLIPIVLEPIFHVLSKFHPPIFYDQQVVDIALEYHIKIYHAILNQDGNTASSAMREHLELTETHNLRLYKGITE